MNAGQFRTEVERVYREAREREATWARYEAEKFVAEHAAPGLSEAGREAALHSAIAYFSYEGSDDDQEFQLMFRMSHAMHGEQVS